MMQEYVMFLQLLTMSRKVRQFWYGMLILVQSGVTYHMHRNYPLLQNILYQVHELWTEAAGKGGELLIGFWQNKMLIAVKNNIQITGFKNLCTMKFLTEQLQ